MNIFTVVGPSEETVTGTAGEDRLKYTLASGLGGAELLWLIPSDIGGSKGEILTPEGETTTFRGIEAFTFIDEVGGDDHFVAGIGIDKLYGRAGNDTLWGSAGDDILVGGRGADTIFAGNDNDYLSGGPGRNHLYGQAGDDELIGGVGNERLFGGTGSDTIAGFAGNDVLRGQDGADTLYGGSGDDRLLGGRKADMLEGGEGDDVLKGGFGQDRFVFLAEATGAGSDTILDFKDDVDSIEIDSGLLVDGTTVADLIAGATVVGGGTVLTLADGETLTIEGLTDASLLSDDLVIV